jgi:hypothetical protein
VRGILALLILVFGVACWALLRAFGLGRLDSMLYALAATVGALVMCWGLGLGLRDVSKGAQS